MADLFRRRFVRVVLVAVGVVIVLGIVARILVPADTVRDLIVTQIKANTGIDVKLGKASVSLFPRLRVVVADGTFSGTGKDLAGNMESSDGSLNSPAPSRIQSFQGRLQKLEVELALKPLLQKKIQLGKVRLVSPHLELITLPVDEGATPTTDAGQGQQNRTGPGSTTGKSVSGWELALAGIEVRDGSVVWQEAGTERSLHVDGWQQDVQTQQMSLLLDRLNAFQQGAPPPTAQDAANLTVTSRIQELTLQGWRQGGSQTITDLYLQGKVSVPTSAERLDLEIRDLTYGPATLTANLELTPPTSGDPRLRGDWQLQTLEIPELLTEIRELLVDESGNPPAWLVSYPVTAGSMGWTGQLDLPWPLPTEQAGTVLAMGGTMSGTFTDVLVTLAAERGNLLVSAQVEVASGALNLPRFKIQLEGEDWLLDGSGVAPLPGFSSPLRLDGQVAGDLAVLEPFIPAADESEEVDGLPATLQFAGRLEGQVKINLTHPPAYTDTAAWRQVLRGGHDGINLQGQLADVTISGLTPGAAWRMASADIQSDLATISFTARDIVHPSLRGALEGEMTQILPVPVVVLDLNLERFDVDQLVSQFRSEDTAWLPSERNLALRIWDTWVGLAVAAAPVEAASTPLGERLPADLRVTYRGRADELILQKARYDDVSVTGKLVDKVATFSSVQAVRSGGSITGQGSVDYSVDPHGYLDFTAEAKDVPAAALLAPYASSIAQMWIGNVSTVVQGHCSLQDKETVLASLNLEGDALSTNGHIDARNLLAGISPYLGQRQDLKIIRFKEFLHHLEVNGGRYHLKDLRLSGFDTDWVGDGWLGFSGGIDMNLAVKLPANFQPELGDLSFLADGLRGDDDRIRLDLRLSGQASRPKVDLDLSRAKAQAGENLEDQVKQGVQGFLDKLKRK